MAADRALVTSHSTIWSAITAAGHRVDGYPIGPLFGPKSGTFTVGWYPQLDGDPVVGISYVTARDGSHEWGARDIVARLFNEDDSRRGLRPDRRGYVCCFTDASGIVLSLRPLATHEPVWGAPLTLSNLGDGYPSAWADHVDWANGRDIWSIRRLSRDDLRQMAKAVGVRPLPTRKDALVAAIVAAGGVSASTPDEWPAWFEDYNTLVLRAGVGVTATVVDRLKSAVNAGTLGVVDLGGAFSNGMFLFDSRDVTDAEWTRSAEAEAWVAAQHQTLAPVLDDVASRGCKVVDAGYPHMETRDGSPVVVFWARVIDDAGTARQGWFDLDELAGIGQNLISA